MRRVSVLVWILALFAVWGCAKEPTVDEIVSKMTEAAGGAETLKGIEDQVSTWDFKMLQTPPGMMQQGQQEMAEGEEAEMGDMTLTITYKRPNKLRMDTMGPNNTPVYTSCYNGTEAWMMVMGQTVPMNEAQQQELEMMALTWIDGFMNYQEHGITLEKLPRETVEGTEYIALQATDTYGNVTKYYVNPKTYHIERESGEMVNYQGEKEPMTMTFADYEIHDNVAIPATVKQHDQEGEVLWEAYLKEVKHNVGVPDEKFAAPKAMTAK